LLKTIHALLIILAEETLLLVIIHSIYTY